MTYQSPFQSPGHTGPHHEMRTHPGAARDVDLRWWKNNFAFHPANTKVKQLGHELARKAIASLAELLHWLIPPSQQKSLAFTHLGLVLMYANQALAVEGGTPLINGDEEYTEEALKTALQRFALVEMPEDPRIADYKAEQLQGHYADQVRAPGAADDAPRSGFTGVAVQEAAEPGVFGEEASQAGDAFRMEELSSSPETVDVVVVAGKGVVQIASLARSIETKREALPADLRAFAQDVPDGHYGSLTSPVAVNQLISALAAAGDRAWPAVG